MFAAILLWYFVAAVFVAIECSDYRKINFFRLLVICILLSPVLGALIALSAPPRVKI
ncbi:MAG TPA: hypothetical protein VHA52_13165 [Candidatus Babeliaceae bacterium]|nr:hypothetical protein [Candidatus Babeliaceae bacterium]